jgi:CRISPR system Cascade subunit CasD
MRSLLLRFKGIQSWGISGRFDIRDAGYGPSKSGVVGFLTTALGRSREEPVEDLAALEMGVRTEWEDPLTEDFQTAGVGNFPRKIIEVKQTRSGKLTESEVLCRDYGIMTASGEKADAASVSRRYFRNAVYLVALGLESEGMEVMLTEALKRPAFSLYMGRKNCPVTLPFCLGSHDGTPEEVLTRHPITERGVRGPLRLTLDCKGNGGILRDDYPISFSPLDRRYGVRRVRVKMCRPPLASEDELRKWG